MTTDTPNPLSPTFGQKTEGRPTRVTHLLRTYFYLLEGEPMPPDADDAWFVGSDPAIRSEEQVALFAMHARCLVWDLQPCDNEAAYQVVFYDRAKKAFGEDKASIGMFFTMLYLLIFGKSAGPRWGHFVDVVGKDTFCTMLINKLDRPL